MNETWDLLLTILVVLTIGALADVAVRHFSARWGRRAIAVLMFGAVVFGAVRFMLEPAHEHSTQPGVTPALDLLAHVIVGILSVAPLVTTLAVSIYARASSTSRTFSSILAAITIALSAVGFYWMLFYVAIGAWGK